ncbi:DUF6157 family protein [Fluviicola taffensis]|uniref:Uncharacterized protein n=1 Tax=Fluviicola taffensis (strain DSM 16823 / NCIMB 13979 / RW262) TaxID=755732 RepID=F2IH25_FLUTR|nr:DUF6157 family protein [Fluviicola taffensis]AEA45839.1 hypothetical protein Fluta_3873 [Fluviicola taffensis DSM 16823]
MKIHTTNYFDTFIAVADDCPSGNGEIPPVKENGKTIANLQVELLSKNPYKYTSDDVLFQVFADRNELVQSEYIEARTQFFSKGQPCFRASALTKRYGWGVHFDKEGKMALFGSESEEYKQFMEDESLKVVKAMKSNR